MVNVHFHRVAFHFLLPAIKRFLQRGFGEGGGRTLHQGAQNGEFAPRQADRLTMKPHRHLRRIEFHAAPFKQGVGASGTPAGDGAHAGRKLVQIEGFADIIVCARIKARDALWHLIARSQQKNRCLVATAPHGFQNVEARAIGQHQVEHDRVVILRGKGGFRIAAIRNGVHGETGKPKPYGQSVEKDRVVFHHKYAHEFLFLP